jgi:hypothetical protein
LLVIIIAMSDEEGKDLEPPVEEAASPPDAEDGAPAKANGEGKGKGRKKEPEVPIEELYDLSKPIPKVSFADALATWFRIVVSVWAVAFGTVVRSLTVLPCSSYRPRDPIRTRTRPG